MKKATCTTFISILNTIREKGITTQNALIADQQLYTKFWFALEEFCHYCLLSKNGGKDSEGGTRLGNIGKIDVLEARCAITRKELETDCAIKIVSKLDLVLSQPIEKQKNYCYAICNNIVNDCLRKLPAVEAVPWDAPIISDANEDGVILANVIGDNSYNPEINYLVKEAILNEVALLNKHPAEMIVRLACTHLAMKPRLLASLIINKGCELAFAEIVYEVAMENNIGLSEIRSVIAGHKLTAESVKADSNNAEQVANQISRLVYRADKRLSR